MVTDLFREVGEVITGQLAEHSYFPDSILRHDVPEQDILVCTLQNLISPGLQELRKSPFLQVTLKMVQDISLLPCLQLFLYPRHSAAGIHGTRTGKFDPQVPS